jgi:hypothetical protein
MNGRPKLADAETPKCPCLGSGWVCEQHPDKALDESRCGAAALPCACNPGARLPFGFVSLYRH